MKQVTPGTLGSSKLLTQTLSLGEVNLKVVLTQARSSARARLDAARSSIADSKSGLIRLSNGRPALRLVNIKAGRIRGGASKAR
jgi:hypothetical protein